MNIGVIGGTVLFESEIFSGAKSRIVKTAFGEVEVFVKDNYYLIQRHGLNRNTSPHRINHRANISALYLLGVEKIISIVSTGSLKKTIPPSSIVIADDYFSPWNVPTLYDDSLVHVVPSIDEGLRKIILAAAKSLKMKVVRKGTYVQASGPRYETKAETKMESNYGDVAGMTAASEATIANELKIPFAMICSVDNYCNGISNHTFTYDSSKEMAENNQKRIMELLKKTIELLNE